MKKAERKLNKNKRLATTRSVSDIFGDDRTVIYSWPFDKTHGFFVVVFHMWLGKMLLHYHLLCEFESEIDRNIRWGHFSEFCSILQCPLWCGWCPQPRNSIYLQIAIFLFRWVRMKAHQSWILADISVYSVTSATMDTLNRARRAATMSKRHQILL